MVVLDTAVLIMKRAKDRDDPELKKWTYTQDCWRSAYDYCIVVGHRLPNVQVNLSFYFAFNRNTNPGERDIKVLKECHGNASRQARRDTITVARHRPFTDYTQLLTRHENKVVPTDVVWQWMQLWIRFFGRRHNVTTSVRSDAGQAHKASERQEHGRLALRKGVNKALSSICDSGGSNVSSLDLTIFGGTTTVGELARGSEEIRLEFSYRIKDIFKTKFSIP